MGWVRVVPAWMLALLPVAAWAQAAVQLPTIEVIETAPASPATLERDKVPANVQVLPDTELDHAKSPSLPSALLQYVPGVILNDVTGNPYQPDVQYRGFVASPVIGTPQGLAVYQNGVRINEVFGDTVNWDLIPEMAISRMTLVPNNPVYGLNALGGAISIEMKNGFSYKGVEGEARGGSFGRRAVAAQAGGQNGNLSGYVAADAINDDGWRDHSPSQLRRLYADIGARNERTEFHLAFTGASNRFGAIGPTPIELLQRRWESVYTTPQNTWNNLAFLTASGTYRPSDTLTVQSNAYFRGFWQRHVDGNVNDVENCLVPAGFLCLGDPFTQLTSSSGPIPASVLNGMLPGEIDRTSTAANSFGGTLQATSTSSVLDRDNQLVVGASIDHGLVHFTGSSELGTIGQDLFVTGTGVFIDQPAGDIGPVDLLARTTYTGFYATDTLDLTSKLSVTAGARFNVAQIRLEDQIGTALNGSHQFSRFNPVVGATYKIVPNLTAYAGYSEANRAPTPLELGCADPARPCIIDNFLVSDPSLKQVVSHTYEAGLRGGFDFPDGKGKVNWNVGVFRTNNTDDILNIASPNAGHGFFQNAGNSRREGVEAGTSLRWDRWSAYANYTYIDATFQSVIAISSPHNPAAVNGMITIMPGDRIPSIPRHRFKMGGEYAPTEQWKLGADLVAVSSQYLHGDDTNQNPKIPAYWVVNLHASYKPSKNVELFGLVQNLFNRHYATFGTFFDTTKIPFLGLTDPRMLTPGMPLAAYVGLRATY